MNKSPLSRRNFLNIGMGIIGGSALLSGQSLAQKHKKGVILNPGMGHQNGTTMHNSAKQSLSYKDGEMNPMKYLTTFDYGKVRRLPNGGIQREYTIIAQDKEIEVAPGVIYPAWTYNGYVPGPTLRCTEGDRLKINFINAAHMAHTIHFHGIHPAKELIMVINGFDTDFDGENEFYTVNGFANCYAENPINIKVGELVRIYLVNMTEFDFVNSFHLHGNMFRLYRTGTNLSEYEITDTVMLCQGERCVIEFSYKYPGMYMFHAHQNEFAELGWMGFFNVLPAVS